MNILSGLDRKLVKTCELAAGALMLLMMGLVFFEVVGRYFFGVTHGFVPDLSTWLMIWITNIMIGALIHKKEHIAIDIMPTRLHSSERRALYIIHDILAFSFAVFLSCAGFKYVLMTKQLGISPITLQVMPMWIIRLCVPMGGFILAYFSVCKLIDDIGRFNAR